MKSFLAAFVSMLLWTSGARAELPAATSIGTPELQTFSEFTAHLNYYYSDLNLQIVDESSDDPQSAKVIEQLRTLEEILQGRLVVPNNSLDKLACTRCACVGCQ